MASNPTEVKKSKLSDREQQAYEYAIQYRSVPPEFYPISTTEAEAYVKGVNDRDIEFRKKIHPTC